MAGNTYHIASESDVSMFDMGGVELLASGVLAASAAGAGVKVGRGRFDVVFILEAATTTIDATNHGNFYVEANTVAAPTVWVKLAALHLDVDVLDTAGAGVKVLIPIFNPCNHQIRLNYVEVGTTSITVSAKIYPVSV